MRAVILWHFHYSLCLIAIILSNLASAQSKNEPVEKVRKHSIALGLGHTQVYKGFENGKDKWLALPSWALDYNYHVGEKWALSLQNEIIMSDFKVESNSNEKVIERSTPFSSMLAVSYIPVEFLCVFVAAGGEFAKEENFALIRMGLESALEINERFEAIATLNYDQKIDGYDSFGLTFGIGYKF